MTSIADRPIAIISAPGTRGDVNPMVGIGRCLHELGFDVVISLAENYKAVAHAHGLQPEALISKAEFDALVGEPNVWRPLSGARAVLEKAAANFIQLHLDVIARHHRPGRTVLVAHPLDFASRIYRDFDRFTPMVSVHLSPVVVRDAVHPPRLSPWWFEPRRPAWLVKFAYTMADKFILDRYLAPSINTARNRLGLSKVSRILDRWWLSPDLVLGLYPSWFGDSRPPCDGDWKTCGFPLIKNIDEEEHSVLKPGSNSLFAGNTILFTPGTAHRHASDFFLNAVEATRRLGARGVLATSHHEQLPADLPPHIASVGYIDLIQSLPNCSAIVHHGGIGTTTAAIATGCPQLICPLAFDQFHNAEQITKLGVGHQLVSGAWKQGKQNASRLSQALANLIRDTDTKENLYRYSKLEKDFQGDVVAAEAIARLLD